MDSNITSTTTSIGETTSATASSTTDSVFASPAASPIPEKLCRVGSGTSSIVLDSENVIEAESRKLPSSQYKGVVPQPNGRWGAQIYEKHQRVWLGTFNEEEEAAKAYDIAAQRFRGRDAITNFKPASGDVLNIEDNIQAVFLNSRSKAEIVDMLRKHTYNDELEHSKRKYSFNGLKINNTEGGFMFMGLSTIGGGNTGSADRAGSKTRAHLFEKAVTPSDVGKLNRLVIPKQHAEKHFPLQIGSISKGLLLNFEDNEGKVWRFRYSYWNSSQSYVLTKGWSRFVKDKCLKPGDVVSFQRSTGADKQLYIDWKPRNGTTSVQMPGNLVKPVAAVRLFGVDIFIKMPATTTTTTNGGCDGINSNRMREIDLAGVDYEYSSCCNSKKQRIVVGAL